MNPNQYNRYYNQAVSDYTAEEALLKEQKEEKREVISQKTHKLRDRIEKWCEINGYDNMDNDVERKNDDGTIYYSRTDWEMVDDLCGLLINDEQWWPHPNQFKKMNELWKRYK
jgi:nucleoid-associated protein YejK